MGDSKLKGSKWVGNIFQKFESIYHDVDDIVRQDTFKYVENQIQSVGKNVKKIYTDLLPMGYPDKHVAEDVASENIDDVSSTTCKIFKENSVGSSEKQSPTEPNDHLTSQLSVVLTELNLEDELSSPTFTDILMEESGSNLRMGKEDVIMKNGTGAVDEEIAEPIPAKLMSSDGKKSFSESSVAVTTQSSYEDGQADLCEVETITDEFNFLSAQKSSLDYLSEEVECVSEVSTVMVSTSGAKMMDSEQQSSHLSSQHHLLDQLSSPACIDTPQGSESNLCLETSDDILITETPDANNEEFFIKRCAPVLSESNSPGGVKDFKLLPIRASSQNNDANRHAELSKKEPETPAHEVESESLQNWTLCDDYADKVECGPDALSATSEMSFSVVSVENTTKDAGLASFSRSIADESLRISESAPKKLAEEAMFCHNSIAAVDFVSDLYDAAHDTSEHSLEFQLLDSKPWDEFVDETGISKHGQEFECHLSSPFRDKYSGDNDRVSAPSKSNPVVVCSVVSGDNAAAETGVLSVSGSDANKLHISTEIPPKMLSEEATSTYNSVGKGKCVSSCDGSSLSAPILSASSKNKDSEGLLFNSYFTAEANLRSMDTMPLPSSCGKQQVKICESVQDEPAVSSSDTGCLDESSSDIYYCHMESIDLHDKVQIQENCVNVEDSVLHAISRRVRKQRSYKKQLQDSFTSKKRLVKEYEQLAIWFGDVGLESSQKPNSYKHNLETHLAAESEWELL